MLAGLFWLNDRQWARIQPHLPTGLTGPEREDDQSRQSRTSAASAALETFHCRFLFHPFAPSTRLTTPPGGSKALKCAILPPRFGRVAMRRREFHGRFGGAVAWPVIKTSAMGRVFLHDLPVSMVMRERHPETSVQSLVFAAFSSVAEEHVAMVHDAVKFQDRVARTIHIHLRGDRRSCRHRRLRAHPAWSD